MTAGAVPMPRMPRSDRSGNRVACSQLHKLVCVAAKQCIVGHDEAVDSVGDKGIESCIEFARGAGSQHFESTSDADDPGSSEGILSAARGWRQILIRDEHSFALRCGLREVS